MPLSKFQKQFETFGNFVYLRNGMFHCGKKSYCFLRKYAKSYRKLSKVHISKLLRPVQMLLCIFVKDVSLSRPLVAMMLVNKYEPGKALAMVK